MKKFINIESILARNKNLDDELDKYREWKEKVESNFAKNIRRLLAANKG